jgi:ABC-type uncharacterized transport system permease subunit
MLLALMKVFIFLCVLIVPLRGPVRRRESKYDEPKRTKNFSNYGVNTHGCLEKIEKKNKD